MARKRSTSRQRPSSLTADEQRIYNELLPFMPGRPKPDLLELYKAASVAHKLRSQELADTSTRGTKRQRIIASKTDLLSKLIEQGMTTERLRQLATIRQVWPTKKQFIDELIKPSGSGGFELSPGHVLRLVPLCKTDDEITLRRELVAAAIQHKWTVAELWEQIRDGRKRLDQKRPGRKKQAGS